MNLKNKKAAVGSTLTWVVATFVIVFILAIYFIFGALTYVNKHQDKDLNVDSEQEYFLLTYNLKNFLASDAGYGETMYELCQNAWADPNLDSLRDRIFEQKAEAFLTKYFSSIPPNSYNSWMRIYPDNVQPEKSPISLFSNEFDVYLGLPLCDPSDDDNRRIIDLPGPNKLVVCIEKS